jgi:hypothetical protein
MNGRKPYILLHNDAKIVLAEVGVMLYTAVTRARVPWASGALWFAKRHPGNNHQRLQPSELEADERELLRRGGDGGAVESIGGKGDVELLERLRQRHRGPAELSAGRGIVSDREPKAAGREVTQVQRRMRRADAALGLEADRQPIDRDGDLTEHQRQRRVLSR